MSFWIKYESSLPTKPEVAELADILGMSRYEVVGRLMAVWAWANEQTQTGHARSVTESFLDELHGARGFAKALQKVGWLRVTDKGISFPHFDRHMSQTAKRRALTAVRVKRCRNAQVTPKCAPEKRREEKRREEGIKSSSSVAALRSFLTQEGFKGRQLETILAHPNATPEQVQIAITNAGILAKQRKLRGSRQAYIWAAIRDNYERLKPKRRKLRGLNPEEDAKEEAGDG